MFITFNEHFLSQFPQLITLKNPVNSSKETKYVSTMNTTKLKLFREITVVYCENNNTFCVHNAEFLYVKADNTYRTTVL
jgi:hypothetical protein